VSDRGLVCLDRQQLHVIICIYICILYENGTEVVTAAAAAAAATSSKHIILYIPAPRRRNLESGLLIIGLEKE